MKKLGKTEALVEIRALLDRAIKENSRDFVRKARNIQMKYRLRLPSDLKRKFCKDCLAVWVPGKTVRIRTRSGMIVFFCESCKKLFKIKAN